jgi:hypothetical protein
MSHTQTESGISEIFFTVIFGRNFSIKKWIFKTVDHKNTILEDCMLSIFPAICDVKYKVPCILYRSCKFYKNFLPDPLGFFQLLYFRKSHRWLLHKPAYHKVLHLYQKKCPAFSVNIYKFMVYSTSFLRSCWHPWPFQFHVEFHVHFLVPAGRLPFLPVNIETSDRIGFLAVPVNS